MSRSVGRGGQDTYAVRLKRRVDLIGGDESGLVDLILYGFSCYDGGLHFLLQCNV